MAERHTISGRASQSWRGGSPRFSEPTYRYGDTAVGPVLAVGDLKLTRPCCCTGLTHEHDPAVCPDRPAPTDDGES